MVRGGRLELGRARVDRLEDRTDLEAMSQLAGLVLGQSAQLPDLAVGESHALGVADEAGGDSVGAPQLIGHLVDEADLIEEPRVDRSSVVDLVNRGTCPERTLHQGEPPIMRPRHVLEQGSEVYR